MTPIFRIHFYLYEPLTEELAPLNGALVRGILTSISKRVRMTQVGFWTSKGRDLSV